MKSMNIDKYSISTAHSSRKLCAVSLINTHIHIHKHAHAKHVHILAHIHM